MTFRTRQSLACAPLLVWALAAATSVAQDRGLESSRREPDHVQKGRDYALLFATDTYDDRAWQTLRNPVRDATTIARELTSLYGFEEAKVVPNARRQDIIRTLYEYRTLRQFAENDQLLVFFAGHGRYDRSLDLGYIVARDSRAPEVDVTNDTYVSFAELYRLVNAIKSKHIFLVLDVCHGGTFPEAVTVRGGPERADYDEVTVDERISRILQRTTRKFLTSGGNEYVPDGSGAHSPFAAKFLEALRRPGRDGAITATDIYLVVRNVKPNEPRFGDFGNYEPVSDFIFVPAKTGKTTAGATDSSPTRPGNAALSQPATASAPGRSPPADLPAPRGASGAPKPPLVTMVPGDYSGRLNGEPPIDVWLGFSGRDRAVLQYRLRWDEADPRSSTSLSRANCRADTSVLECTTMSGRAARFHVKPSSNGIVLETESAHLVEALIAESVNGPRAYLKGYGPDVRELTLTPVSDWSSGKFEARVPQTGGGHVSYSGEASLGGLELNVERMSGGPFRSTFHAEASRATLGQLLCVQQPTGSMLKCSRGGSHGALVRMQATDSAITLRPMDSNGATVLVLERADAELVLTRVTQQSSGRTDQLTNKQGEATVLVQREGVYQVFVDRPGYARMEYEVRVDLKVGITLIAEMERVAIQTHINVSDSSGLHKNNRGLTIIVEAKDKPTGAPLPDAVVRVQRR